MNDYSCVNGWTMGDISTSTADAARFFYYYLGTEKFIRNDTRSKMLNFDIGQEPGFPFKYGLGLLLKSFPVENG